MSGNPFDPTITYDANLRLLDRQLVDPDGRMCGKVDDLELRLTPDRVPEVVAILTGPGAWAPRTPGLLARWTEAVWRRLHPSPEPGPRRIAIDLVTDIDNAVHLSVSRGEVAGDGPERWTRDHLIGKLPGARHDPE
jgi:hypothetical protein